MFDSIFLAHPRTVNESYLAHGRAASRFGLTMLVGGLACLVHALVPALFPHSASDRVVRLHAQMTARRRGARTAPRLTTAPGWTPDYQI